MIALPDMTYDEAESLWPETDYASEATHQDENPINGPDATAFFLEGYLYARKRVRDMQRFRPLPPANATPCHPLAAYYCDDCGEPDWTDATAGGDIRKFYSDDDRGDTICEVCMRKRVTTDDKRGVVAATDGGDGAPENSAVERFGRCQGCGELITESEIDSIGGHCRAVDDGKGNPVPTHCGPVGKPRGKEART